MHDSHREPRIEAIDAITLTVPAEKADAMRAFYVGLIGLVELPSEDEATALLRAGNRRIRLCVVAGATPPNLHTRRRMTIDVPSLEKLSQLLRDRRVNYVTEHDMGLGRHIRVHDPAGYVVELKETRVF